MSRENRELLSCPNPNDKEPYSSMKNNKRHFLNPFIPSDYGQRESRHPQIPELLSKSLEKFQTFYISKYNNFYSKRFRHLDINFNKTENLQIYETLRDEIIKSKQKPNIVYEIIDIEKKFVRVGRSAAALSDRMKYYLNSAFSQFIVKINLDSKIEDKTIELLEKFISIKNLDLNVEFKGVIAGGIYLACQILGKPISQKVLSSNLKIDDHTISKWYRDIGQTIT